jgi:hypothetical protein
LKRGKVNSLEELEDLHECVKPLLEEHGEVDIIRFGSLEEGEKVMGDGGSWVEISKNVVEFFEELEKRGRWDVIYELTRRGGKRARRAELIREWKERMKVPQEEEQARKKEHEELGKVIEQEVEGGGEAQDLHLGQRTHP